MDCNQNLTLPNSSLAGLSRLLCLCRHRGLEFNPLLGNTWEARNEFSAIDWVFFRWPGVEIRFHLRPDLRTALPSDQVPVVGILYGRTSLLERPPRPKHLCGRWVTSFGALSRAAQDPTFVFSQETFGELIRLRKVATDPESRAKLMCDIHAARVQAQRQHKLSLLEGARSGDRSAIAHLRRSASQTFSEGSFIERLGGQQAAVESMQAFYARKYSLPLGESEVTPAQVEALRSKHAVAAEPMTVEEVNAALEGPF